MLTRWEESLNVVREETRVLFWVAAEYSFRNVPFYRFFFFCLSFSILNRDSCLPILRKKRRLRNKNNSSDSCSLCASVFLHNASLCAFFYVRWQCIALWLHKTHLQTYLVPQHTWHSWTCTWATSKLSPIFFQHDPAKWQVLLCSKSRVIILEDGTNVLFNTCFFPDQTSPDFNNFTIS